jgi:hypothetical protein
MERRIISFAGDAMRCISKSGALCSWGAALYHLLRIHSEDSDDIICGQFRPSHGLSCRECATVMELRER